MLFAANKRAKQLRDVSGHQKAGVYDPQSIGGTHVIYVLHDAENPEAYGNLPRNPTIPLSFTIWKSVFKPVGLLLAMTGFLGALFHYVFEGPHRPQPQPKVKRIDPPPPAVRKEA
jgi:hypothetical protein